MLSFKGLEQADLDLSSVNTFWCSDSCYTSFISITGMSSDFFFSKEMRLGTNELRQVIVAWMCVQQSPSSHSQLSQIKYLFSLLAVCPYVLNIFSTFGPKTRVLTHYISLMGPIDRWTYSRIASLVFLMKVSQ